MLKKLLQKSNKFIMHNIGRTILQIFGLFFLLCKGEVRNLDNIPKYPCVLVANHTSYADWLVLFSLFKWHYNLKVKFVAKKRLFKSLIWGAVLNYGKAIYLDQEHPGKNFIKTIKKCINQGEHIFIFPEGTRSKTGKLMKGQNGAVRIAINEGLPIVPLGLIPSCVTKYNNITK